MMEQNIKSVYWVLSTYLDQAKKKGNYVKGYIDGKEKLELFLKEYSLSSRTKFIIRSSCKKVKNYSAQDDGNIVNCTRYGRADRIYWEFNNRNLVVPFTGMPFVTNSSQVKHCQHGAQYYKLKAEKIKTQANEQPLNNTNPYSNFTTEEQNDVTSVKRRRLKPSKKRNCPAYMYIREVIMFPEFGLNPELLSTSKHILRKEKSNLIKSLKEAMRAGNLVTIHRHFVNVPLPEAHSDHPLEASVPPLRILDPFVRSKIDELLTGGVYEVRHIQLIINDYVQEALAKNGMVNYSEQVLYPSEQEISDYVYLSSISEPTVVEFITNDQSHDESKKLPIQSEMEESVNELSSVIQTCKDEEVLNLAKKQMRKLIQKVKLTTNVTNQHNWRKRNLPADRQESKKAKMSFETSTINSMPPAQAQSTIQRVILTPVPNEDFSHPETLRTVLHDMLPTEVHMPAFSTLMGQESVVNHSLMERVIGTDAQFHTLALHGELSTLDHLRHDGSNAIA